MEEKSQKNNNTEVKRKKTQKRVWNMKEHKERACTYNRGVGRKGETMKQKKH
jgi:hypothetical protein